MSLHPYIPPPPLALAIVPAPPIKPSKPKPKHEKKDRPADKADADINEPKKARADDDADGKQKADGGADDAHETLVDGEDEGGVRAEPKKLGAKEDKQIPDVPETPLTPVSMMPEPPTPDVAQADARDNATPEVKADDIKPDPKSQDNTTGDAPTPKKEEDKDEPEPEPKPLRLTGPTPHTPIRTRLSMNPIKPYPPIDTDPRGAYHFYAKGCSKEWILIDVTKDGWLSEFFKGKEEREALARLRGEDVRKAEKEAEKLFKQEERGKRVVPETAGDLLVQLWNDLAEAPWTELPTETFWERYDWSTPAAQAHAKSTPKGERKENTSLTIDGQEVEWTKEGVEEILGTVGVQCAYNSDIPIHRQLTGLGPVSRDRAFLLLGHGYFILRPKEWLVWKPEEGAGDFEVLVTSGHDRVFGDMVKAQRIEAKRKDQVEADKAKKAAAKQDSDDKVAKNDQHGKNGNDGNDDKGEDGKDDGAKDVKKGPYDDKVKGGNKADDNKLKVDIEAEAEAEAEAVLQEAGEAKLMLAVPVHDLKDIPEAAKHEHEVQLAQPGEMGLAVVPPLSAQETKLDVKVAVGKEDDKAKGEQGGKVGAENMKMEDIKAAFQALEAAAGGLKEKGKTESEQLVWTWAESCERWRWRNFEAGVHEVALGGWEERDWKVFADGKGMEEFEGEMEGAELVEEDVHDWSC